VAHSDHVLGEFGLAFNAAFALADLEGFEAILVQIVQNFNGGDIGVALGPAGVLASGKGGRGGLAHLLLGQRALLQTTKVFLPIQVPLMFDYAEENIKDVAMNIAINPSSP
jgi:hypothetical protein